MRAGAHTLALLSLLSACKSSVDGTRRSATRDSFQIAWISQAESFAVWEAAPDDVWVSQREGLLHWDGKSLNLVFPAARLFASIWGSASEDVWAAGYQGLAHWDGREWEALQGDWPLYGVGGTSASDVWVVGCESPQPGRDVAVVFHYDGTAWCSVALENDVSQSCPRRVWGSSSDDFWMAGVGIVAHWDGQTWSRASLDPQDALFTGLWGTGPTDVWTLSGHEREGDVRAWHWNGKSWTGIALDTRRGFEVWGRSQDDFFAGGDHLFHWAGDGWSALWEVPFEAPINAIHGGPKDLWVAGFEGVLHLSQ